MTREKRIETAAVGSVTLEFDLNRIEGDVVIKSVSPSGWPSAVFVPVVDLIGAVAKMGNRYVTETSKLLRPEPDQLEGDSEDCTIPEHTHTAAQRRRLRTTESAEGLSALGPVAAAPRRLGLSPEEEAEGE